MEKFLHARYCVKQKTFQGRSSYFSFFIHEETEVSWQTAEQMILDSKPDLKYDDMLHCIVICFLMLVYNNKAAMLLFLTQC